MDVSTVSMRSCGLSVSEMALGTWRFGMTDEHGEFEVSEKRTHDLLDAFVAAGGNFIDSANIYADGRSERWIGNWLESRDREDFVIASKIFWPTDQSNPNASGLNRKHLNHQLSTILDRLQTQYIDILYIHRWDDETPVDEFMRTLSSFVDDGLVHYLGASTLRPNSWKIVKANEYAYSHGLEPFRITQPRYNLIDREIELNYQCMCEDYGLDLVTWSPLAWGFLTGKYRPDGELPDNSRATLDDRFESQYLTDENFAVLETVEEVSREVDASPAQIALAWLLHQDAVTAPVIGARTIDQLSENLEAATISLTNDQLDRLNSVNKPVDLGLAV